MSQMHDALSTGWPALHRIGKDGKGTLGQIPCAGLSRTPCSWTICSIHTAKLGCVNLLPFESDGVGTNHAIHHTELQDAFHQGLNAANRFGSFECRVAWWNNRFFLAGNVEPVATTRSGLLWVPWNCISKRMDEQSNLGEDEEIKRQQKIKIGFR